MSIARVSTKAQVTIPREIRAWLRLQPGARLAFRPLENMYLIERLERLSGLRSIAEAAPRYDDSSNAELPPISASATVTTKGQITIPKEVVDHLRIEAGSILLFTALGKHEALMYQQTSPGIEDRQLKWSQEERRRRVADAFSTLQDAFRDGVSDFGWADELEMAAELQRERIEYQQKMRAALDSYQDHDAHHLAEDGSDETDD